MTIGLATVFLASLATLGVTGLADTRGNNEAGYRNTVPVILVLGIGYFYFYLQPRAEKVPWNPVAVFLAVWTALYAIRPFFMLAHDNFSLRNRFYVESHFRIALLAAALAAASYIAGDWLGRRRTVTDRSSSLDAKHLTSTRSTGSGTWSVILMVAGSLAAIGNFGSELGGVSAYLYYAPLLIVPGVLLTAAEWSDASPNRRATAVATACLFSLSYTVSGQRAFVLVLLTGLIVVSYLRRGTRPTARGLLPLSILFFFVIIVGFQSWRDFNRGATEALTLSPSGAIEQVFLGGTTEMLPALASLFQTEGVAWEQQPGRTSVTTAVHWIPGKLWPDKPKTYDEELYKMWFPDHYAVSKANVQYSLIGDFYTDSGWIGIGLGFALLGFGAQRAFNAATNSPHATALAAYAPVPVLILTTLRGNLALNLGLALFLVVPSVLAYWHERGGQP